MQNNAQHCNTQNDSSQFPVKHSIEQIRDAITNVMFHQARNLAMIMKFETGLEISWKVLGHHNLDDQSKARLLDPEVTFTDCNVTYNDIKDNSFTQCIENMYTYGNYGIQQTVLEPMLHESIYMWVSASLEDFADSSMFNEWESYGSKVFKDAKMLLEVAELANARRVLEGHKGFYPFGKSGKNSDNTGIEGLTVRQMALLTGMEEMSIRAAANPKRANPIPTFSEEGKTRIAVDDAKKWLQEKNRYIAITKRHIAREFDLARTNFKSREEFLQALNERTHFISDREEWTEEKFTVLEQEKVLVALGDGKLDINPACLSDHLLLHKMGKLLDLSVELLVLRAREALAHEELAQVEKELKTISKS